MNLLAQLLSSLFNEAPGKGKLRNANRVTVAIGTAAIWWCVKDVPAKLTALDVKVTDTTLRLARVESRLGIATDFPPIATNQFAILTK